MVDLFLDIETVPDMEAAEYLEATERIRRGDLGPDSEDGHLYWKCTRGALKYTEGRIILITYQVNDAPVRRLKEWESGESAILTKFYTLLQDLQRHRGEDPLRHHLDDETWLHQWVVNGPVAMDLLQMHLPVNGMSARGLKHDVLAHAYSLPVKESQGGGETERYFRGDYSHITEYSEREFIYPQMFRRILDGGMVSAETLAESIRWHESRVSSGAGQHSP